MQLHDHATGLTDGSFLTHSAEVAALGLLLAAVYLASGRDAGAQGSAPPSTSRAASASAAGASEPLPSADPAYRSAAVAAKDALRARHGDGEWERINRGVDQVMKYWRRGDGDAAAMRRFCETEFLPAGPVLDATFGRLEFALERIGGYMNSIVRDLRQGLDLEIGPILPLDERLGAYDVSAHLSEDLFENGIAFVTLLNFPLTTLDQRLAAGGSWTRRQWAETRLAHQFTSRVPAEVNQKITQATSAAGSYIADYNIYMHHVLTADGRRLFPEKLRLLSHWNLRDELKARYADPEGLPKQRMISTIMEKIVRQEIPAAVVNNPLLDWTPDTNAVTASPVKDSEPPQGAAATARNDREPDTRYERWMGMFKAYRLADPYFPDAPTFIDRRFNVGREIPETQVKALFEALLTSPLGGQVGRLVEKRLGRPLEPFDIWYVGFKPRGKYQESQLDDLTKKKYPTPEAYAADIPRLLRDIGFSEEKSRFVADHIVVDPARGSGHALGATRRDDQAHLRTRVGKEGMDYKGYNIAVHEMGHNVEQVFSVTAIDHTVLQGVPNTAFTEAMAFLFQENDLRLLGLGAPDPEIEKLRALEDFWGAREIAGVALVDMAAWHWLYDHPEATPAQFREAVVGIAKDVWNRYNASIFKTKDVTLLAIYSHMVDSGLYIPDYPLGHLIAFQVGEHFRESPGTFGSEFERICKQGSITPDAWMRGAVGSALSAEPLLKAASAALASLK